MFNNNYCDLDPALVGIAKAHACILIGSSVLKEADADDILQILVLAGIQASAHYRPSTAKRSTYLYAVIHRRAASLARNAMRAKRTPDAEAFSLDELGIEDEPDESNLHDILGWDKALLQNQRSPREQRDLDSLRMDVADAIAAMPARLAGFCELLRFLTAGEAQKAAGVSASARYRLIASIRKFLKSRGIHPGFEIQRKVSSLNGE